MSTFCDPTDHSQVLSVRVFSPFPGYPTSWLALQQCINTAIIGYKDYGPWDTVVSVTPTAGLAASGYVMFTQNADTPGTPTNCYLVDIYANRSAQTATDVVKSAQTAICMFLNAPPLPSVRVVFAVRYAEPETLAPRESGNVNIEGGYPPSSNSKIARLESEVKMLQEKLVSKL